MGPSHNLTALVRSKVELTCEASGNPLPQFTWVHHTQAGDEVKGHEKNLIITGVSYPDQGTLASKSEMNVNRIYNEIRLLKYGHRQAVCPDKINGGNYKPSGSWDASTARILTEISLCCFAKIF